VLDRVAVQGRAVGMAMDHQPCTVLGQRRLHGARVDVHDRFGLVLLVLLAAAAQGACFGLALGQWSSEESGPDLRLGDMRTELHVFDVVGAQAVAVGQQRGESVEDDG